jgi:hypothetical protein
MASRLTRREALAVGAAAILAPTLGRTSVLDALPDPGLLDAAFQAFAQRRGWLRNTEVIGVVDFSLPSYEPRMFIIGAQDQSVVRSTLVAHGKGSDPAPTPSPVPTLFSNAMGSEASCLGGFVTGRRYLGRHGLSLRIVGMDPTNSNAEARDVVIHSATYVDPERAQLGIPVGWSEGCFAVPETDREAIIRLLGDGAFLFAGVSSAV